eukprot:scaffold2910_cov390-Prasinococcus_capsulatus_cf.AAC.61
MLLSVALSPEHSAADVSRTPHARSPRRRCAARARVSRPADHLSSWRFRQRRPRSRARSLACLLACTAVATVVRLPPGRHDGVGREHVSGRPGRRSSEAEKACNVGSRSAAVWVGLAGRGGGLLATVTTAASLASLVLAVYVTTAAPLRGSIWSGRPPTSAKDGQGTAQLASPGMGAGALRQPGALLQERHDWSEACEWRTRKYVGQRQPVGGRDERTACV